MDLRLGELGLEEGHHWDLDWELAAAGAPSLDNSMEHLAPSRQLAYLWPS